ncbi:MAG TPA: STAS/SEC14 domain-containing protein [Candidatus Acidoferrum sp.]|nr:STAS/SEC14 domain-containing protein [Candidatus Acidoferrum sp.]
MIEQLSRSGGRVLGFRMSGKLHDEDYQQFLPLVETAMQANGKVRLLALFQDFHGWDLHAVWDDTKFAARHRSDVERIALVGEKAWEKWMALVCKPFTKAEIRYFDAADVESAWKWLEGTD